MLQRAAASSLPRARSNRRGGGGAILPCFQAHPVSVRSRTSSSSSISSGECDAPVAGTYYRSSHVDCRGRLSTFATVVVNADKGRSASPVWSQACSLLGTNAPTLAVAFVSKHTPSSAAAMEELGSAFGSSIDGGGNDPKLAPFIGCVADVWNVAATTTTTTTPGGDDKRKKLVSSSSSSSARASGDDGRSLTGSQGCVMLRADAELSDDDTVEEFKALVVDCARWTRENPGVVADSDDLVALDKKIGLSEMKNNDLVACDRKVNEETKVPDEVYERKTGVNEPKSRELALEREENGMPVVKIEAYSSESKNTDVVPGIVSAAAEIAADGGGGVVSPQGGVVTSGGSTNQSASGSDESVVTEDDDYRMILCVANLPGIKATSFHTTTTGLPNLPDMETAVVRSNPHMLLLGAPGYPYPEFVQRLSVVFPESCRAGAFLSPLYSSPKGTAPRVVNKFKPLFAGSKPFTAGVVGLAISPDGDHEKLSIDAFTEFLRMSLGMARIAGHNFFDNAVSNSLFFPKNAASERHTSPRSTPIDPGSLLKRLQSYLLRHSRVQTQSGGAARASGGAAQDNALNVSDSGSSCTTTLVEVKDPNPGRVSDSAAAPAPASAADESQYSDKMPLALLDTVLFPGWSMPLHMHEPRYRQLVRQCVEEGKPFGLTSYWHWQNSEELVGTMANLKVYLFEKDCRSYVVAHGLQRFRLPFDKMWVEPGCFGLNMGQVEFFEDGEFEQKEELLDLAKRVVDRCLQLLPEAESVPGLVGSISDPTKASFAVGQLLPVPVRVKRRWLGMADTKFRLLEQMTFLNS